MSHFHVGARIAQSVYYLSTDGTTEKPGFDPWQRQKILPLVSVQTSIEAHPVSYPMGTSGSFLRVKRGQGMTLTTHTHQVLRSRMSRIYTPSPPCRLHGGYGTVSLYISMCSHTTTDFLDVIKQHFRLIIYISPQTLLLVIAD
jgi:hypothetical protein